MENVLIRDIKLEKNIDFIRTKELETNDLDRYRDFSLITTSRAGENEYKIYLINKDNDFRDNNLNALIIDGVGIRSNLKVMPIIMNFLLLNKIYIKDIFINETKLSFYVETISDADIINKLRDTLIKEGFDVE
ncbi:MAG: hypothetical protein SVN78_06685 [Deferribacterota bacterium]|nr:hypothetical protein [Deferribacterota bacterium]